MTNQLLHRWRNGDDGARDRLMELLYPELRQLAAAFSRSERRGHTLPPTAIVHEAYLRLAGTDVEWVDRGHFFAIASSAMRRVLVDYARAKRRLKRDDNAAAVSRPDEGCDAGRVVDVITVDRALTALAESDTRQGRVIEMYYFGGMTYGEIAGVLELSPATVKRDLRFGKAWLATELAR